MKKSVYGLFCLLLPLLAVAEGNGVPEGGAVQTNAALQQWEQARVGMFIHFGVYSGPAGVWHGETIPGHYAEHLMRLFRIPLETYKTEVAAPFNPTNFNADEWVRILKDAGMGYMVITAKHHDGFAMYDSEVSDYNIVKATAYGRDPMRALRDACKRQGVLFGFYYSHAQDWSTPDGVRNNWDFNCPTDRNWTKTETNWYPRIKRYYDEKAIPQLVELVKKYDPDIIWFDTAFWGPDEYNRQCVDAVLAAKPNLIINSRGAGDYRASYKSTNDRPVEFPRRDGLWEAIPSINRSYGYHCRDHTHCPPSFLIELICKAAAKGGNVLINVGPRGDGTIDKVDQGVLAGVGEWMKVNGEAIRGTEANPLPTQSFGEVTRRGNTLYCHIFQWPKKGRLVVGGLASDVDRAYLLTNPSVPCAVRRLNATDVQITLPDHAQEMPVAVLALECDGMRTRPCGQLMLREIDSNRLHVTDARWDDRAVRYAGGNWRTDYIKGWKNPDTAIVWDIRANEPGRYDVFVSYDANKRSDGNRFGILVGETELEGTVVPGIHRDNMYVGRVALAAGGDTLSVHPLEIAEGSELMKLRSVHLVPVGPKK